MNELVATRCKRHCRGPKKLRNLHLKIPVKMIKVMTDYTFNQILSVRDKRILKRQTTHESVWKCHFGGAPDNLNEH